MSAEHELSARAVTAMLDACTDVVPPNCPIALKRDKDGFVNMNVSVEDKTVNPKIERALIKCMTPVKLHSACRRCRLKLGVTVSVPESPRIN